MCDKAIKNKDMRIAHLEAALLQARKKEESLDRNPSKSKTQVQSQRISVESNKENITCILNPQYQNVRLEDFLRKKGPSNPLSAKQDTNPNRFEAPQGTSSTKVLLPSNIEFNNKLKTAVLSQRPATSSGYPSEEGNTAKPKFKSNSIFGENLSEMFRKKKNASSVMALDKKPPGNLTKQLSINTPKFDYPLSILKPESPHHLGRPQSVEKRTEIEGILLKLLEEHKETKSGGNNFLNKLNFIERAIKR